MTLSSGHDGDLYGDGINIAVRLEGVADPGGILMSEKVFSEVEGKLDVGFEDRGEQQLKNITKPVRAYAVRAGAHSALTERLSAAPPLPDKPSIAVLPFENMSGDPEQEYFADGMVEEIITALSRFKSLFVIARNSSFTFKGRAVDIKEVGRKLGVRYVLEGAVRKAAGKVRITGQLIDAITGAHIWADRFERDLTDVFALQDEVTARRRLSHSAKIASNRNCNRRRGGDRRTPPPMIFFSEPCQHFYLTTREEFDRGDQAGSSRFGAGPSVWPWSPLWQRSCHMNNVVSGYAVDPQFDRQGSNSAYSLGIQPRRW